MLFFSFVDRLSVLSFRTHHQAQGPAAFLFGFLVEFVQFRNLNVCMNSFE